MEPIFVSEKELIRGASAGDLDLYNFLIAPHTEAIYNFARKITCHEGHAHALTLETFLAAFQLLPDYEPKGLFLHWIYAIAVKLWMQRSDHSLLKVYRKKFAKKTTIPVTNNEIDPMIKALQKLSRMERMLVVLWDMQKLSYAQIIAITGYNEDTLAVNLEKAREKLNKLYTKSLSIT